MQGPVVQVKPQPNVYTVLVIIAAAALVVALVVVLNTLMSSTNGYGMEFGQLFDPWKDPTAVPTGLGR
jgi:hypothetical protein